MSKLQKHYLTFEDFLFSPVARDFNSTKIPLTQRLLTSSSQLKGAFSPLSRMGKDFIDTFKPYRSTWYAKRDAKQPLDGIYHIFKGIAYILGSCILLIGIPFYYLLEQNREDYITKDEAGNEDRLSYFDILASGYICILSWFIDGILSIIQGATQLLTTPLTYLFKIPVRAFITRGTPEEDLLIENRPGIQAAVKKTRAMLTAPYYEWPYILVELKDGRLNSRVLDEMKIIYAKYEKAWYYSPRGKGDERKEDTRALRDSEPEKAFDFTAVSNNTMKNVENFLNVFSPPVNTQPNSQEETNNLGFNQSTNHPST